MSTKIGGPYKCNIHPEFEPTEDREVFNEHCKTTEGHTTTGVVQCVGCGASIEVTDIPFQELGKELRLECPQCYSQTQDINRLVNDQQQANVEQQFNPEQPQVGGQGA